MPFKAVVIGNCQVKSLAYTLNTLASDMAFDHFQVHSLPASKAEAHIDRRAEAFSKVADVVLTFNLGESFYSVSTPRIAAAFPGKPVMRINNLYFSGYHPDIIILGDSGKRVDGHLDQYHSKLALFGYLRNLKVDETVALFKDEVYTLLGYYDVWEASARRMVESDENVDLPFGGRFVELLKMRQGMFVVNHPAPFIFVEWARTLIAALEQRGLATLKRWTPDEAVFPHLFSDTAIFPVYPEVTERLGLPFLGSYVFKGKGFDGSSFLSLRDFISAEYGVFEASGRALLLASKQAVQARGLFAKLDAFLNLETPEDASPISSHDPE